MNIGLIIIFIIVSIYFINMKQTFNYIYYFFLSLYIILLYIVLFNRTKIIDNNFSNGLYLFKWFKIMFINKTVFINILGNIFLFMPFGIILKKLNVKFLKSLLLSIIIIVFVESLQYISKRGVFDIGDIILNIVGIIIGYVLIRKR